MKVLISTRPAFGHVYPLMPLADAARAGGHVVEFATTGSFLAKLERLGFAAHDAGLTLEQAAATLAAATEPDERSIGPDGRPDLELGGRMFIDVIARRTAADLKRLLPDIRPDVVVYEQYDFGAAVAAHAAGIPAVCHALSPRLPDAVLAMFSSGRLEALWAEQESEPGPFDAFIGDAFLDIVPTMLQQPSFCAHPARIPMRPIPYAEPGTALPAWVAAARRPLIYLTLGTVVATDAVLRPAIDGLATLGGDILLALGSATGGELGALPDNVHVEAFVDQPAVLRQADLVVHHGGSGTMLGALAQGTAQLLLPKGADQFFNADLMVAAGLASALAPVAATPDAVAEAASAELADRRPAVDIARAEIDALPHPAEVLDGLLDRLVSDRAVIA